MTHSRPRGPEEGDRLHAAWPQPRRLRARKVVALLASLLLHAAPVLLLALWPERRAPRDTDLPAPAFDIVFEGGQPERPAEEPAPGLDVPPAAPDAPPIEAPPADATPPVEPLPPPVEPPPPEPVPPPPAPPPPEPAPQPVEPPPAPVPPLPEPAPPEPQPEPPPPEPAPPEPQPEPPAPEPPSEPQPEPPAPEPPPPPEPPPAVEELPPLPDLVLPPSPPLRLPNRFTPPALPPPPPPAPPAPRAAPRPPPTQQALPGMPGSTWMPEAQQLARPGAGAPPAGRSQSQGLDLRVDPRLAEGRAADDPTVRVTGAQVGADWRAAFRAWLDQNIRYPRRAIELQESGTVRVLVTAGPDGSVRSVRLVGPSGSPSLNLATTYPFNGARLPAFPPPADPNGVTIELTVNYRLVRR